MRSSGRTTRQEIVQPKETQMKRVLLLIVLLAATPIRSFSQGVLLQAGDVYSCEFNNLQFQFHIPPGPAYNPLTRLLIGKQDFSGSFLVEAFEDNLTQPPLFSTNVSSLVATSTDFYFGPAWQDLQGAVRVTMLSGSMDLSVLLATVTTSGPDVYSQSIVPAPEPSPVGLLAAAALPMWYLHRRTRVVS
jgi:hypothetical protein